MLGIVFALGRPGSGKSTAAHHLTEVAWEKGLSAIRMGDYKILHQMFLKDTRCQQFRPTQYGGFDVTDFSVLNLALRQLKAEVEQRIERVRRYDDQLIIIEFARDNYCQALETFGIKLLQRARFVYINADVPTCIRHIQHRARNQETPDDHFVSEAIMNSYYAEDDRDVLQYYLCEKVGIPKDHLSIINNTGSHQDFTGVVKPVIHGIIRDISKRRFVGEGAYGQSLQWLFAPART